MREGVKTCCSYLRWEWGRDYMQDMYGYIHVKKVVYMWIFHGKRLHAHLCTSKPFKELGLKVQRLSRAFCLNFCIVLPMQWIAASWVEAEAAAGKGCS